jgi:hypothetical protein
MTTPLNAEALIDMEARLAAYTDEGTPGESTERTLIKYIVGAEGEVGFEDGWETADQDHHALQYVQTPTSIVQFEGFVRSNTIKTADSPILETPLTISYRPTGLVASAAELPRGRVVMLPSGMLQWERDIWPFENNGEGITAAVTPTPANSGGISGDAFTEVSGIGAELVAATDQLLGNVLFKKSYKVTLPASPAAFESYVRRDMAIGASRVWGRMYFRYGGVLQTGGTHRIVQFAQGASRMANIVIRVDQASPSLRFQAGVNGSTFVTGAPAIVFLVDTNYRLEWDMTFGVGDARLEVRIFAAANVNGLVPDDVLLVTAQDTNSLELCDRITFGSVLGGHNNGTFWFGGLNANTDGYPGPYLGLIDKNLPTELDIPVSIRFATDYVPEELPTPPAEADFMFAEESVIQAMARTGTGWDYLEERADAMMARGTSVLTGTPGTKSPLLSNYNDNDGTTRPTECLANGLWYVRNLSDFPTEAAERKQRVIDYCRYVIGTEEVDSTIGTTMADRSLAVARALPGYIIAADLVGMPKTVTGTRTGWTTTTWQDWLVDLRTKQLGNTSNKLTFEANLKFGTNHGTMFIAAKTAIAIYLEDADELAECVAWMKKYTGETYQGTKWTKSSSFIESWVAVPPTNLQDFVPINPSNEGSGKNGSLPEEICRSGLAYPNYGAVTPSNAGIGYTFEGLQGFMLAAILIDRQGYTDVWDWGAGGSGNEDDAEAIKRAMEWLYSIPGMPPGNGRVMNQCQAWIANHYYPGLDLPTSASLNAASMGFFDALWTS